MELPLLYRARGAKRRGYGWLMVYDYRLCGLRVASTVALPQLMPWDGDAGAAIDVSIETGSVPDDWSDRVPVSPRQSVAADGSVLLRIPGLLRMLVMAGNRIVLDLDAPEDMGWQAFLLGSGLGFLCHQRGLFPLHAACLVVRGRTIAIAGVQGVGKSTLSSALLARGHRLLSDDVTVLQIVDGRPQVLPAFPRLKLWGDSVRHLGLAKDKVAFVRGGMEKYDLPPATGFDPAARPLDHVVLLTQGARPEVKAIARSLVVPEVRAHVFRPKVAHALGRDAQLFMQTAALAGAVPVHRVTRGGDFAHLSMLAGLIEDLAGGQGDGA